MSTYASDDGHSNQLTTGLSPEIFARQVAQRLANERGACVYLYEIGMGEYEAIQPEGDCPPDSERTRKADALADASSTAGLGPRLR